MQEAWGGGDAAQCALGNPEKPMQYAVPIYLSEHLLFTRNLGTVVWKPWPLVPPHPPLTTVTFYQWLSVITERCKEARVPEVLGKMAQRVGQNASGDTGPRGSTL